ncbi:hypothetical protein XH79_41615 [Bradyrhizobium sp. CCBAU 45389]|nr:hypothetical protein [Bradyrhizobium sp. CCBAU 45389]
MRSAAIFVGLLRIPRRFPCHISRVEMVLAIGVLARLLLIRVLLVSHWTSHSLGRVTMLNGTEVSMFPKLRLTAWNESSLVPVEHQLQHFSLA